MQTNFTTRQLQSPKLAEAEAIIRKCVHCGLCTATCSSYVLLGDERDSPRGRIYLIKEMFERGGRAGRDVTTHVDRCLSCLSCMTTCPSGVDYMHLVDLARAHIYKSGKRPLRQRLMHNMLARVLTDPKRMRQALRAAPLAKPFKGLLKRLGFVELDAMLDLAPMTTPRRSRFPASGTIKARGECIKRVALIPGCAQQVLRPRINDAAINLLIRHGVEVVIPPKIGCCGALEHHMGRERAAIKAARRIIDGLYEASRNEPLDAVLVTASGCGTHIKDYAHLLKSEPGYARRAEDFAALSVDVTEFLVTLELHAPVQWSDLRIAYHSACSMQHGQKVNDPPRDLLRRAGYNISEVPEGHLCCGSAGSYNIMQSEIATGLRDRKVANIEKVKPDAVAAGNIGCIEQLARGMDIPIVHTVELVDWALGGLCPVELRPHSYRMKKVASFMREPQKIEEAAE